MPVDLLTAEESALRRFSPSRNIWRAIAAFDETAAEFEGQARELMNAMQLEHEALAEARQLDREALADWAADGSKGTSPASEVTRREERIEELQRQLEGVEHQVARVLADKAAHVERHRDRLAKDAAKATTAAERRYAELIDEAERARQETVELREAELWARTYPDVRPGEQEVPPGLAGNLKAPLRNAGIEQALDPGKTFDVLRADAAWIPTAAKPALKPKLGEPEPDGAVWLDSSGGQDWQRDRQREARERIEQARTWGLARPEWGDPDGS